MQPKEVKDMKRYNCTNPIPNLELEGFPRMKLNVKKQSHIRQKGDKNCYSFIIKQEIEQQILVVDQQK